MKQTTQLDNQKCSAMTGKHVMQRGVRKGPMKSKSASESASKRPSQIASALSPERGNSLRSCENQTAHHYGAASITAPDNVKSVVDVGDRIPMMSPAHSDEADSLMEIDTCHPTLEISPDQSLVQQLGIDKGSDAAGNAPGVPCSDSRGEDPLACLADNQRDNKELQKDSSDRAMSDTEDGSSQHVRRPKTYFGQRVLSPSPSEPIEDQNRPFPHGLLAVDNHETNYNAPATDTDHSIGKPCTCRSPVTSEARNSNANYIILAKNTLSCNQMHDQQVMGGTRCIVQDQQGRHEIMTWSQIEREHQRGILFEDSDFGYGIHTKVDKDFLKRFTGRHKSRNIGDFQVVDAIMHHSREGTRHYITVFLKLSNNDLLHDLSRARADAGYDYRGPIRCCVSVFRAAGGKKWDVERVLKKRQPAAFKRYQESRRSRTGKASTVYQQGKVEQFLGRYEGLFSEVASLLRRAKKIECTPA
jgi:hypothetical protein